MHALSLSRSTTVENFKKLCQTRECAARMVVLMSETLFDSRNFHPDHWSTFSNARKLADYAYACPGRRRGSGLCKHTEKKQKEFLEKFFPTFVLISAHSHSRSF